MARVLSLAVQPLPVGASSTRRVSCGLIHVGGRHVVPTEVTEAITPSDLLPQDHDRGPVTMRCHSPAMKCLPLATVLFADKAVALAPPPGLAGGW